MKKKIIFFTAGVDHLKGKSDNLHIIDSLRDYWHFCDNYKSMEHDVYSSQPNVLQFWYLKNHVDTIGHFDELNVIHYDKTYYARFEGEMLVHNFDTEKDLRYAHNLQRYLIAGGCFSRDDE